MVLRGRFFFFSSYLYGLLLFIYAFVITFFLWGWLGVIVGLFLGGIGIAPVAFVASLFSGEWHFLLSIILSATLVYGCRFLGIYLISKHEDRETCALMESYIQEISAKE